MSSYTYPGVYIEEVPSGVRTITGVSTSITAFVGRALRGPVNQPVRVQSFAEYSRLFGGLWQLAPMGHAVSQFFQNGGADALIVRAYGGTPADGAALLTLTTTGDPLVLEAASPGAWGRNLRVTVDHLTDDPGDTLRFNLLIQEMDRPGPVGPPDDRTVLATESFRNVSVDPASGRFVDTVLNAQSALVNVRASAAVDASPGDATVDAVGGDDGTALTNNDILGEEDPRTGLYALEHADLFNLLCLPPREPGGEAASDVDAATLAAAAAYCQRRRAMLLIDGPAAWSANQTTAIADAEAGVATLRGAVGNAAAINAAVYYPRLRLADPLSENRPATFAPCGAVAGIIARTDSQRGVWKAPAGLGASFSGAQGFDYTMTDQQNGRLNPLGVNCLRTFPAGGHLVWGSRTLAGNDQLASEWKYLPVRRTALFLEESLFRGLQWVVFEPNDESLWSQIRLNVGAFMQNLFRQGAFQGSNPREAYFVVCDATSTTQNDIDQGIVNILVGFAPVKPAEFVVVKLQQMAGQVQA